MRQLDSVSRLVNRFTKLPGVGVKTAQRYAYAVIEMSEAEAVEFSDAILDVKKHVKYCNECGNFTEGEDSCGICKTRDKRTIIVVAHPKDVLAIEKAAVLKGVYHVLHGTLSPLEGRGPNELRLKQLMPRLEGAEEVILATNPDVEGEATAMYIAKLIKPFNIKVTRLAQGISLGSDIEYTDEVTLARAIDARVEV